MTEDQGIRTAADTAVVKSNVYSSDMAALDWEIPEDEKPATATDAPASSDTTASVTTPIVAFFLFCSILSLFTGSISYSPWSPSGCKTIS